MRLRNSLVFALACATACTRDHNARDPDGVTRTQHGDTIVVTTTGNGVWGAAHDAIEVKRIAGGSKETTFGSVYMLAATPDGGVVLFDSKSLDGMIVRQFDADGKFVRNIGRRGTGPGEYDQIGQLQLTVHSGGTILLRDGSRAVSRYAADGRFLNGFPLGFGSAGLEIVAATNGSIYVRGAFTRGLSPAAPQPVAAMLHYDSAGTLLDSIVDGRPWLPRVKSPTRFTPQSGWSVLEDGRLYFLRWDKVGFLIVDRSGIAPPLIADFRAPLVPYLAEERAELAALDNFERQHFPPEHQRRRDAAPAHKLPTRWSIRDNIDGRIWIAMSAQGQKSTPHVAARAGSDSMLITYADRPTFAAFQTDGTFLGVIRFPMGVFVPTFVGNTAWAIVPGDDDVPTLVKYKLHQ
jgi:hypothetical protein